jgi:uncharacterized protein (TIGR02996 family)
MTRKDLREEQGFLDAIRGEPDDDAHRLVYADWLDEYETGEGRRAARAEFIRIQCALSDPKTDTMLRVKLKDRERRLLAEHQREWEQPLRDLAPEGIKTILFRRGFPQGVRITAAAFFLYAEQLLALVPVPVREVGIGEFRGGDKEALAASPYLANLTSLTLDCELITEWQVRALAASPYLAYLRSLSLDYNCICDGGAQALASSPHLANLRSLSLDHNYICDRGAQALAASPHLANLNALVLRRNKIGDGGARALASSPHLANLTSLDLSRNPVSNVGARAFVTSPHLANLTSLDLHYTDVTETSQVRQGLRGRAGPAPHRAGGGGR